MKKLLLFAGLIFLSFISFSQSFEWFKCLGGSGSDRSFDMDQTIDGGCILVGSSWSSNGDVSLNQGGADMWIVKLNPSGDIEWEKSIGGSNLDVGNSIQQTSDGGYIVAGTSSSTDGDLTGVIDTSGCWVVKINPLGVIEWSYRYGSPYLTPNSIKQTSDGGYIVVGDYYATSTGAGIMKLSSTGAVEWQKPFGQYWTCHARSVHPTTDGGCVVAGTDSSGVFPFSTIQAWVAKLDSTGNILWETFGNDFLEGYHIGQTNDGGYIVSGEMIAGSYGPDGGIMKLSSTGTVEWEKSIPLYGLCSVQQTLDGGYIVAGDEWGSVWNNYCWNSSGWKMGIVKLDSAGNEEWGQVMGGYINANGNNSTDIPTMLQITSDHHFILLGETDSYGCPCDSNQGSWDFWIGKGADAFVGIIESDKQFFNLYPNPTTGILTIEGVEGTVKVYDIYGRLVLTSNSKTLDISQAVSGIYFVRVLDEQGNVYSQKVVKE